MANGCPFQYAPKKSIRRCFLCSALLSAVPIASLGQSAPPSPATAANQAATIAQIAEWLPWIGVVSLIALICAVWAIFTIAKRQETALLKFGLTSDRDLDALRIVRGFWLIIAGLLLSLAVAILAVTKYGANHTGDVVAVITAVTGVIATLIAAFFGVQAASAGSQQALATLGKIQSRDTPANYSMTPGYGPTAGNTKVSINGNGFTGANAVNFGTTPGRNFEFVNDGLVYATSPPAPATNKADVAVIFPTPFQQNVSIGCFYYYDIDPPSGKAGDPVTIIGAGFAGATAVKFGDAEVTAFSAKSDTALRLIIPAQADSKPMDVDVAVIYPVDSPTNRTVVGQFHYNV